MSNARTTHVYVSDGSYGETIPVLTGVDMNLVAEHWLEQGDFETGEETQWLRATVYSLDEDDKPDQWLGGASLTLDPPEPDCGAGEHDWQSPWGLVGGDKSNPGVFAHGGGVIINEVCIHCSWHRITDTWAQDPATGEQGLRSVRYQFPELHEIDPD